MSEDIIEQQADIFKALGDGTRLLILKTLFDGEKCVTDLAKTLGMDPPRVSFHLTRLKYTRLVVDERQGQRVIYRLNPKVSRQRGDKTEISFDGCVVKFGPVGRGR